jgi:isoleucyl-tRNA synthetase
MLGEQQRYQNGFDCQGLWVEVEVERELGFGSKRDIEAFGIDKFVELCKERVWKYSGIQTEQSKRLGYFMDWDNSYYTMSEENNYTIWRFLKTCHEQGWIYKGEDSMPWCPRCGTGLSEMEISDGYTERTHRSLYLEFPLVGEEASLLVWTTTPWTLPANVAAAVHPELTYLKVRQDGRTFYVAKDAAHALRGEYETLAEVRGADLIGKRYRGPFDELPRQQGIEHPVIAWDEVAAAEGTGIVHIAPGGGTEDYHLGKELGLPVIAPLDESGHYIEGFDWLNGQYAHDVAGPVIADIRRKGLLYREHDYTHRYATCLAGGG